MRSYLALLTVSVAVCGCIESAPSSANNDARNSVMNNTNNDSDNNRNNLNNATNNTNNTPNSGTNARPNALTCPVACEPDTPFCDVEFSRCVECLQGRDCPDGGACLDGSCSECSASIECDSELPICVNGVCVPCSLPEECVDRGLTQCFEGKCVECTVATQDVDCLDFLCDPATHTCRTVPVGTLNACEICAGSAECAQGLGCVEVSFDADGTNSRRCLPKSTAGCSKPYPNTADLVDVEGDPGQFCIHDTSVTSCDAILAYGDPCAGDDACPTTAGLCRTTSADGRACTYSCATSPNCPVDSNCTSTTGSGFCASSTFMMMGL